MSKIIVVGGQTAAGKSQIATELAKKYNGIIINADSRQIYRDLNIGTAKPTPQKINKDGSWIVEGIQHFLFGFASLETEYNIFKYQKDVKKIIEKYPDKNIFLVGGTGLYIDSIIHGYLLPKHTEDSFNNMSIEELQLKLGNELESLNESDRNNPRRLISKLKQIQIPQKSSNLNYLYLVLEIPKEILNKRIEDRIHHMFNQGLEEEVLAIYNQYPEFNLPSLNTIGYKEFKEYFENKISLDEVKTLIITHTRQYAKRQKTWFRRNKEVRYVSNLDEANQLVLKFINTL